MSPTCTGHPRYEVEGEPEELEEDETIFEGKSEARTDLDLRPTGGDDIEGRPKFDGLFKRESCRRIGRIVERSMEVFGRETTATRDDKGDVLVQPNNPG